VEATSGATRFVLTRLEDGGAPRPLSTAIAHFKYLEGGKEVDTWCPEQLTVLDATGNAITTSDFDNKDGRVMEFDALCRFESAWKLRVRFVRARRRGVPADYLWTVRNVPMPLDDVPIRVNAQKSFGEVSLDVGLLDNNFKMPQGGFLSTSVEVRASAPVGVYQVSLNRVTDERGHDLLHPEDWRSPLTVDGSGQSLGFDFHPPTGSPRRLNLTFAVHRTRTVEFLVKPPSAQAAGR